jgi:outer membrane protein assembly factor BamB
MPRRLRLFAAFAALGALVVGAAIATAAPRVRIASAPLLRNWPEFGLNPQRSDTTADSTGITAGNLRHLRRVVVALPGTPDNSAIYLHGALVDGARHDVAFVTTSYGITLAVDANSGAILWRFDPRDLASWQGSAQVTTATPIAIGKYVYAASPDGLVHKLSIADGREAPGWPVRVALAPKTEKMTPSLNVADGELLAGTGGYDGDAPPYVGHLAAISLASGRVVHVFNTLCANRATLIEPSTCSASDSAILSRSGPVVEPGGTRVLIATGNAPYDGTADFGDSLIELTLPGLRFRQAYTPTDQAQLNSGDVDFGSGSPALLPGDLVVTGGKDGILRVLNLTGLDGRPPGTRPQTGGDVQDLPTPGNTQIFSAPAVSGDDIFVATGGEGNGGGTAAYRVGGGRLRLIWQNQNHGSSPILAGGLLYVYDIDSGGVFVYDPAGGHEVGELSAPTGHWNSPIVVDRHVIITTGDDNNHLTSGELVIYVAP